MIKATDYDSLQSAVNAALKLQRGLFIPAGEYSEDIVIEPQQFNYATPLNIVGEGVGYDVTSFTTKLIGNIHAVSFRGLNIANLMVKGRMVIDPNGTTRGSSWGRFRDMMFTGDGSGTGILVTEGSSLNADRIHLDNVVIEKYTIGVSYGQSQSRANLITGGGIDLCDVAVDTATYARENGSSPKIHGTQIGRCGQFVRMNNRTGAPLYVSGIHMETTDSIGEMGVSMASSRSPAVFTGCEFNFRHDRHNQPVIGETCAMETISPVLFSGCQFHALHGLVFETMNGRHGSYTLDACTWEPGDGDLRINGEAHIRPNCYHV